MLLDQVSGMSFANCANRSPWRIDHLEAAIASHVRVRFSCESNEIRGYEYPCSSTQCSKWAGTVSYRRFISFSLALGGSGVSPVFVIETTKEREREPGSEFPLGDTKMRIVLKFVRSGTPPVVLFEKSTISDQHDMINFPGSLDREAAAEVWTQVDGTLRKVCGPGSDVAERRKAFTKLASEAMEGMAGTVMMHGFRQYMSDV